MTLKQKLKIENRTRDIMVENLFRHCVPMDNAQARRIAQAEAAHKITYVQAVNCIINDMMFSAKHPIDIANKIFLPRELWDEHTAVVNACLAAWRFLENCISIEQQHAIRTDCVEITKVLYVAIPQEADERKAG